MNSYQLSNTMGEFVRFRYRGNILKQFNEACAGQKTVIIGTLDGNVLKIHVNICSERKTQQINLALRESLCEVSH